MNASTTQQCYAKYFDDMKTISVFPDVALRQYIHQYGFFENRNELFPYSKPIPNGKLELIIHTHESCLELGLNQFDLYRHFLVGLYGLEYHTRIRPIPYGGFYQGICIRFKQEGIVPLLNFKIAQTLNSTISIYDIWGSRGTELVDRLENEDDILKKARILDHFFLGRLNARISKTNRLSDIYKYLKTHIGKLSVDGFAEKLNVSARTIHRKFMEEVGMCPKEYLKIIRFNKACQLLRNFPQMKMQDVVYLSGYYDQAHFIHEFKKITHISPMELIKQCSGHFYLTRPFIIDGGTGFDSYEESTATTETATTELEIRQ